MIPTLVMSAQASVQKYGFTPVSCFEPILQTFAVLSLIWPFNIGNLDENNEDADFADINPFFQVFAFMILM
jgi:hypothetical protein